MGPFLEKACREHGLDMILFMLTNIIEESTEMLCYGQDCAELVKALFRLPKWRTMRQWCREWYPERNRWCPP